MYNKKFFILAIVITLLVVSGCQTAATQEEAAASETTAEEAAVSESAEEPAVAEEVAVEGFEGPTEKAKAPEGIKVALVSCDVTLSGCIVPLNAIEEIAPRYNWETQLFDGRSTPVDQNKAILDSISWGADVIVCASLDQKANQQGIVAAYDADIPIVGVSTGTDDPNPKTDLDEGQMDYLYDVAPGYKNLGIKMADWIIADSGGDGNVVLFDCPGVSSVRLFLEGLQEGLATSSTMVVDSEVHNFTFDQLGEQLNRMVTGYVQTHPDVEYIYIPFDPAGLGVVEALETAGYTDVKVVSVLGTKEYISLIRRGTVAAATAGYDSYYMGYAAADQFIRILNGQEMITPHNENVPMEIIDSTNMPAEGADWAPAFDYESAFYALWD